MSGIYISGIEMPKGLGKTITIYPNGTVRVWVNNKGSGELLEQRAVPVPPHGRLKDYERIMKEYDGWFSKTESREYENMFYALRMAINGSPTIIPASKEGEG